MDHSAVLVTGLTGSFGRALLRVLERSDVDRVVAFSRDELKQLVLQDRSFRSTRVEWILGDVRDRDSVVRAARDVSLIVHAAGLKQVVSCERNPLEAIKTNVLGAANVIEAALANRVPRVVAFSSDKAVNPCSLYGATKLCAERLFTAADLTHGSQTRFASVRWPNVIGSRGSVIPFFLKQRSRGRLTVTDDRMTRFWITLEQAVGFVHWIAAHMRGGEVFVPKVPSMRIVDLARALAPEAELESIGIRPGEKLHEILVAREESRACLEFEGGYVVHSSFRTPPIYPELPTRPVHEGWQYASDENPWWLTSEEILSLVASTEIDLG